MKTTSILFAASMAGAVAAQKLSDYFPECSLNCLEQGTKSATDCSLGDAVCFCEQSNYEVIYTTELSCVLKNCGADVSVNKVLPAAVQFCSAATASATGKADSISAITAATGKADSTSATTAATTKTTSHAASYEVIEIATSQTTPSSQSSAAPETTAASSTLVASGRPVTTASATTPFSTAAAAAAAGPMVTAAMLVAGAVALL